MNIHISIELSDATSSTQTEYIHIYAQAHFEQNKHVLHKKRGKKQNGR